MNETWQRDKGLEEDSNRSMSDVIKQMHEDLEAAEWVREHGGIEQVKMDYECMVGLDDERKSLEDENERLRDMLNDVSWALGLGRDVHYYSDDNYKECHKSVMNELRKRLMPEGIEWPKYTDEELVLFDDELPEFADTIYKTVKTISFQNNGCIVINNAGGSANKNLILWKNERVKRHAEDSVPDADNVPINIGDEVFPLISKSPRVIGLQRLVVSRFTHIGNGTIFVDFKQNEYDAHSITSDKLTHEKPHEEDWWLIKEEASIPAYYYAQKYYMFQYDDESDFEFQCRHLVFRCKALAERGE